MLSDPLGAALLLLEEGPLGHNTDLVRDSLEVFKYLQHRPKDAPDLDLVPESCEN